MSEEKTQETPQQETHGNGKVRQLLFRLLGYKDDPKRRGYWNSAGILLRNHKKYDGSEMQIFQDGKWQDLTLKRCEQMARIEEQAIAQQKERRKLEERLIKQNDH